MEAVIMSMKEDWNAQGNDGIILMQLMTCLLEWMDYHW
jgi:hypothetical protein